MKSSILYLFLAAFLFNACTSDENNDSKWLSDSDLQSLVLDDEFKDAKDHYSKKSLCFELVYPIEITLSDGSVLSGEEKELWQEVKEWYAANPNSKEKPSIIYPVDILWKGEISKKISSDKEMIVVKKYCDGYKEDCYQLIYPVTWILPDGSSVSMANEKGWDVIKSWYTSNPESEEKPSISYPVEVELIDGTNKIITSDIEFETLKKKC